MARGESAEDRAAIEQRLLARYAASQAADPGPLRGGAGPVPLSFPQERLWFIEQLVPGRPIYNIGRAERLTGALDVPALRRALDHVVERHEALRTTFDSVDGRPFAVIGPPRPVPFDEVDLSSHPAATRASALADTLATARRRPFDLTRDLMLRATLVRVGPAEHVLLLGQHHIASDGWSNGLLWREVAALYGAYQRGEPPALPSLAFQYADYAVWQRRRLEGPELERQTRWWAEHLAGLPPLMTLPADRRRPAVESHRGAQGARLVGRDVLEACRALGRQERATLFMVLLAGFEALVARYTGRSDVAVGIPIAGRTRVETEPLIGFFVNSLVMRMDLDGEPTFRELLRRVQRVALDAYAHQEVPFERVVEAVHPERSLDRHPLVQIFFALQDAGGDRPSFLGLDAEPEPVAGDGAKFDLYVAATEQPAGLALTADYAADLFERATIERFLRHFEALLAAAVADPDRPVAALPLLSDAERHEILVQWNATEREFPAETPVAELFARQAAATPDAPAVIAGPETLTYRQLDEHATRLARHLRRRGVRAGAVVGVELERSPALIVALLSVLKAGAAYLPLDPAEPAERRAFMLEDAGAVALIARPGRLQTPGPPMALVDLDADAAAIDAEEAAPLPPSATGASLAYVMYTSGSTGRPKGVAIPQRAIVRLVTAADYAPLGPDAVVAHLANPGFDAATWEIWGALLAGARLVVLPKAVVLSPPDLVAAFAAHGVTATFLTAALFSQIAADAPAAFRGVDRLLVGGDVVDATAVRRVLEAGAPRHLVNAYGPTESTTFATWHEITARPDEGAGIPIGRPLANTQAYVLDARREPVPIGVVGELYLGGPGLAEGYVGRPELTAERFVPHPFADVPGARLYRTGDLARWRADGVLEFEGRADEQLKVRGFRVEPGEVEAALRGHPAVREAVVVGRADPAGSRRLVAYVVGGPGAPPSSAELRAFVGARLPEYMVPSAVAWVDALPMTANGKIDRAALPDLAPSAPGRDGARVAPRSPLEAQLTEVWETVLGVRPVGLTDSFFDLGGHSLLALRLVRAMEAACGQPIPLTTLFAAPTIETLAAAIMREAAAQLASLVVALRSEGDRPPLVFLHGDFDGGGFYAQALARGLAPDRPVYVVHPHGRGDGPVPPTIEAMADDVLPALRAARPHGPYVLAGHRHGGLVALEMARRLHAAGERVELVALLDASAGNARPRDPHRLAGRVVAPRGLATGREAERLSRLRRGARAATEVGSALARAARRGLRANLEDLAWRAGAALQRSARQGSPPPPATESEAPAPDAVDEAYRRAVERYVPAPYDGRLVVLRSEDVPAAMPPDLGWSLVSPAVEVYAIPGSHRTGPGRHAEAVGARLSACLDAAPA